MFTPYSALSLLILPILVGLLAGVFAHLLYLWTKTDNSLGCKTKRANLVVSCTRYTGVAFGTSHGSMIYDLLPLNMNEISQLLIGTLIGGLIGFTVAQCLLNLFKREHSYQLIVTTDSGDQIKLDSDTLIGVRFDPDGSLDYVSYNDGTGRIAMIGHAPDGQLVKGYKSTKGDAFIPGRLEKGGRLISGKEIDGLFVPGTYRDGYFHPFP